MITGRVKIDGVDVKNAYGAYVVDGGYVDIPCIPSMKKPAINDWYEYDGLEADLDSPCCDVLEHDIEFMMKGNVSDLDSFVSFIRSARYRTFEMVDIGRSVTMRVRSVNATGMSLGLFRISITVAEDNPLDVEYIQQSATARKTGLTIDNDDISKYGIMLNGSIDGLHPGEDIKDNLLHSSEYEHGEKHYNGLEDGGMYVATLSNDITFGCIMKARNAEEFWKRRNALMIDLFKSGERQIGYNGNASRAYFKDCKSQSFKYDKGIWWEFELSFGYLGK